MLAFGVDDYVTNTFSFIPLRVRIQAALRLKKAQDQADLLSNHLLLSNRRLEQNLHARARDLLDAHKALILALAKLAECRTWQLAASYFFPCRLFSQLA